MCVCEEQRKAAKQVLQSLFKQESTFIEKDHFVTFKSVRIHRIVCILIF